MNGNETSKSARESGEGMAPRAWALATAGCAVGVGLAVANPSAAIGSAFPTLKRSEGGVRRSCILPVTAEE